MKPSWMNNKKMRETTSTQKNCICSSKSYFRSISSARNLWKINIFNSLGAQIKYLNHCVTSLDFKEFANKNKSSQSSQNEHFMSHV